MRDTAGSALTAIRDTDAVALAQWLRANGIGVGRVASATPIGWVSRTPPAC